MEITPYQNRRARLIEAMGSGVALIPTAPEHTRNRDSQYSFRPDSYFHYLSGFPEPEAALLLVAGATPKSILFCRDKNSEQETWNGFRWGPEAAASEFGFDEAYPVSRLDEKLVELIADQRALWFSMGHDAAWDARVAAALNAVRAQARAGKRAPEELRDVRAMLDAMRVVKDEHELAIMRRAAEISAAAHRRAMRAARPGRFEYQIEAEILHQFMAEGSRSPAYGSIVAGGKNACILHYVSNDRVLEDGTLLLIDAGCELELYASDITRTFPVNGRFSAAQADLYGLVLEAQRAAIACIRPGARFNEPHEAALRVLVQGMIDLKLLQGSVEGLIESEAYKRFYMHRTSHWLGLDVHDAGAYREGEAWQLLAPGMVLTVEPGCYVRAADDVPPAFHDIGIRIEDDAVVTAAGCEIITVAAPKNVADIEALMRDA